MPPSEGPSLTVTSPTHPASAEDLPLELNVEHSKPDTHDTGAYSDSKREESEVVQAAISAAADVDSRDKQQDQEAKRLALDREWRERIRINAPDIALANIEPADFLAMLANDAFQSFQAQGQLSHIEQAIMIYEIAMQLLPPTQSELRHHVLTYLGTSLCMRSEWTHDDRLLARAIPLLQEAVQHDPPSNVSLQYLANGYRLRHSRTGELSDLDSAIQLHRDVLAVRGSGPFTRPTTLTNLGAELHIRFSRTGVVADLEEALRLLEEAIELRGPQASRSRLISLHALSNALDERFTYCGDRKDLDHANSLRQSIYEICHEASVASPVLLAQIGESFRNVFEKHGTMRDLENAISVCRRAVQIASERDPGRVEFSIKLEKALYRRYEQLGIAEDLNEAIVIASSVVDAPAANNSDKALALSDLACALALRFESKGAYSDLDKAVDLAQKSLSLRELPDDRDLHISVNILAYILLSRFKYCGNMADLEDSLQLYWKVLDLIPEGHAFRFESLNNLGNTLLNRYVHLADIGDLHEAIKMHEKAVEICPPGHQHCGTALDNLANDLLDRFQHFDSFDDLERALDLRREALKSCPPGHSHRHGCLHNLATTLALRIDRSAKITSDDVTRNRIKESTDIFKEALDIRVSGHPDRPTSLIGLGHAYEQLFDRFGQGSDALTALQLMNDALELLPVGHAGRPKCRFRISRLYTVGPEENLRTAVECFLEAVNDACLNPQSRLNLALQVLTNIEKRYRHARFSQHQLLLEAYLATLRLLPAVAYFGLDIHSRLRALQQGETLVLNGAAHALAVAKSEIALEMLDEGRGLFWTQALRLRTPFDGVPLELSQKLVNLARQLEQDSFDARRAPRGYSLAPNPKSNWEAARRRRVSEEFDQLVDQVRTTPGFEEFMKRPRFDSLAHVADKGPVVVLLASPFSCEAILLIADRAARHVSFPTVTVDRLSEWNDDLKSESQKARNGAGDPEPGDDGRALRKVLLKNEHTNIVLGLLWTEVVKIVIDALQLQTATGRSRSRLWWCSTGQFTFLPIHAAGVYQNTGDCCSDYVVSSYTPTLGALINARHTMTRMTRESAKVLLAAVPHPYKGRQLPYTVEEIMAVKAALPPGALISASSGVSGSGQLFSGASVQDMLENLPKTTILHLASHGYQDPKNPLDSGFLMTDDILTVSKLMRLPLPHAFLAFLSACETAKGD